MWVELLAAVHVASTCQRASVTFQQSPESYTNVTLVVSLPSEALLQTPKSSCSAGVPWEHLQEGLHGAYSGEQLLTIAAAAGVLKGRKGSVA